MATYLSGKSGYLKLGNTSYPFREWKLDLTAAECDISNFTSGGFSEFLTGLVMGKVSGRGPLDINTQLTIGNSYNMTLGAGNNYEVSVGMVVTRVSPSTAVDQAAMIDFEGRTNGSFNTTFAVAS